MIRAWLSYLLITLIALQSVVAVADAHQLHQTGDQHLDFDHVDVHGSSHPDEHLIAEVQSSSAPNAQYDCHHCCHCHGVVQLGVPSSISNLDPAMSQQGISTVHFNYLTPALDPGLRPPIA